MNIYVIRNAQRFGPYDEKTLLSYVNNGQILKQDKAIAVGDSLEQTVGFYLKRANLRYNVPNKGNIISQLSAIGSELIFPKAKKNNVPRISGNVSGQKVVPKFLSFTFTL